MKLVWFAVTISTILAIIPSFEALICEKKSICATKTFGQGIPGYPPIECDVCAGWACVKEGILYQGLGCKGSENICKNGNNQDVMEYNDEKNKNWFFSCQTDYCSILKLSNFAQAHLYIYSTLAPGPTCVLA